ncbi:hypothetical protein NL108_016342 [Boleophthalmus pectinirostris]|nr:hypothetical protein NL108_016342 [Boleophthalmus pectinirostris]
MCTDRAGYLTYVQVQILYKKCTLIFACFQYLKVQCVTFLVLGPSNTFPHYFVWNVSQYGIKSFYLHGGQTRPSDRSDLWRSDPAHSQRFLFFELVLSYETTCNRINVK